MKIQVKGKRMVAVLTMVTTLVIGSALPTFAATATASLPSSDWIAYSSAIEGNYAKISAEYVDGKAKLPVWFVIENNNGGYHDVAKEKVSPAASPSGKTTYNSTKLFKYRLELNPYGTETKGSKADGTITVLTK